MKSLFFIFIFALSLHSASILNGRCVDSFYTNNSSTIYINYSNGSTGTISESKANIEELLSTVNQFYYDDISLTCNPISVYTSDTL